MDAIFKRKSIRSYTGEKVSQEDLKKVIKAAQASPCARRQYERVHLTLVEGELLNEIENYCASKGAPNPHPLYGAPQLLVVSVAEVNNVDSANAAMMIENMSLEAVELNLGQCVIYGALAMIADNQELIKKLSLPAGFIPVGGLTLGISEEKYEVREVEVYDVNYVS